MFLRKKLEELNLHQEVKNKMHDFQGTEAEQFILLCRVAHVWSFGTDPDQTQSWINYKTNGIVPSFVEKWLHSQKNG